MKVTKYVIALYVWLFMLLGGALLLGRIIDQEKHAAGVVVSEVAWKQQGASLHIITRDMNGVVVSETVQTAKDGHLESEHQIPAGEYCKRSDVTIGPREVHAHHCDCTYSCRVEEDGSVTEFDGEKNPKCKAYCSKDGRHCTCHVEEPCDLKGRQ